MQHRLYVLKVTIFRRLTMTNLSSVESISLPLYRNRKKNVQLIALALCFPIASCASFTNDAKVGKNELNQITKIERIAESLDDWQDMRPALLRLTKLENELTYLLDQLDSSHSQFGTAVDTPLSNISSDFTVDDFITSNSIDSGNKNAQLEVGTAAPIMQQLNNSVQPQLKNQNESSAQATISNKQIAAMENKFQSSEKSSSNKFALTPINTEKGQTNSLFVSDKSKTSIANSIQKNGPCSSVQGKYAMHLVSYSKLSQAPVGWQQLAPIVSPISCGRAPLVQEVTVKGKLFYSLRVGPYDTKSSVKEVCTLLTKEGLYCGVSTYEGESI